MFRPFALIAVSVLALSACEAPTPAAQVPLGSDGRPLPVVVRISPADAPRVRQRVQDGINTMRAQNGLGPLQANAALTSAAATHAQDMSFQSRPWHWGSDGSSPMQRAQRAGYRGTFVGELISETFETEVETVNAWMIEPETRPVILDRRANEIGVGWHQDDNGKLWWTVVLGAGADPMMQMAGR
ncbi:MAG: CAP domain-containing protein [Natronohydrobacter sp.]|nr:CAP domain-containing protein [Natronohydrobacter sp.]